MSLESQPHTPPMALSSPVGQPASSPASTQLVVGHDGHPASAAALATATELASSLNAHIHVVHCVTLEDYGIDPDIDEFEATRDRNLAAEQAAIVEALADAAVIWTYHETRGDPAHQIAALAAKVDAAYIVVGASHRGLLRHMFGGGPVDRQLSHIQQRPVVVVPSPHPS